MTLLHHRYKKYDGLEPNAKKRKHGEPHWYLHEIAQEFGVSVNKLNQALHADIANAPLPSETQCRGRNVVTYPIGQMRKWWKERNALL
jgi:hypothetical protein